MIPPYQGIHVFLTIVREGSMRGAATALGLGAPAVSHQLKSLEQTLGVKLFVRTTRSLKLTDAGRDLLAESEPAFAQIESAISKSKETGNSTRGILRITLPWSAYKIAVAPILADFQKTYPDIHLELSVSEALVDIVEEGFHAGMRLGDRLSPGMTAVRLTPPLIASYSGAPSYFEKHGRPVHPRDLMEHSCIRYRYITANKIADWGFHEGGNLLALNIPKSLVFDSFQSIVQAAVDGHGIGWSLRGVIRNELELGQLETVLDDYASEYPPFYLYFTEHVRHMTILRTFIDFMTSNRDS